MQSFRPVDSIRCALIILFTVVPLAGCGFFAEREDRLDDYVQALADKLDLQPRLSGIPTVESLPRPRERVMDLPALNLGLVDFLSLYGCELQVVVGERATTLGRVMGHGKRLEYEIRFLAAARECLPDIDNERRAEQVAEAAWTKEENLPLAIWNGIWGVEEMETLFSRSQGTLPQAGRVAAFDELEENLTRFVRLLDTLEPGELPDDLDVLSTNYQFWRSEALLGKLLRSAEALHTRLDDGSRVLEKAATEGAACSKFSVSPAHSYRALYLDSVWPRVKSVQAYRRQVLPLLQTLLEKPGIVIPESMHAFVARNLETDGGASVWRALDDAIKRHDRAWMSLMSASGDCAEG